MRATISSIFPRKGFSLIELLVVIVISVILLSIAVPSYQFAIRKAKRAEGRSALVALMHQQEQVYTQRLAYAAFSADSTDAESSRFKWFSGETARSSAYEISAHPCAETTIADCVQLIARPGTQRVNTGFTDPQCGTLGIDSRGKMSADGPGCW